MNKKHRIGYALLALSIALVVVAMITEGWFVLEGSVDANGSTYVVQYHIGLHAYSLSSVNEATGDGYHESGTLDSPGTIMTALKDLTNRLKTGGVNVMATGAFALFFLVASPIVHLLYYRQRVGWHAYVASFVTLLLGVTLLVVAFFLYARALLVGFSFVTYLLGGLCFLVALLLCMSAYVGAVPKVKRSAAVAMVLAGIIAVCSAMSTLAWFAESFETNDGASTTDLYIGLKRYTSETVYEANGNIVTQSGNLDDLIDNADDDNWDNQLVGLRDGGNIVLGCGVVAVFAAVAAMACIALGMLGAPERQPKYNFAGMCLAALSGALIIISELLYAKKLYVGYSFIIFIASAFLGLLAILYIVGGSLEDRSDANNNNNAADSKPKPPPPSSSSSSSSSKASVPVHSSPPIPDPVSSVSSASIASVSVSVSASAGKPSAAAAPAPAAKAPPAYDDNPFGDESGGGFDQTDDNPFERRV